MAEKYTPDRFDQVSPYTTQHGRHRQHFDSNSPSNRGLIWIILAGGLALAIGVFCFVLLPQLRQGGNDAAGTPVAAEETTTAPAPTPTPTPTPTPEPSPSQTEEQPVETVQPTETVEASETPITLDNEEEAENEDEAQQLTPDQIDQSVDVGVYNASGVGGMAGRTADALAGTGFNVTTTADWDGSAVTVNTVYHRQDPITAQQVADSLAGEAVVVQTDNIPNGITVVLVAEGVN